MAIRNLIPALKKKGKAGLAASMLLLLAPLILALSLTLPRFLQELV